MRAVLMYHSIDDSGSVISISPQAFAEHVDWISKSGVRVVALDALAAMDPAEEGDAIALTFDDGFANFGEAAALLEEHDLPATVFVVTGHVGRTNAWGGRAEPDVPTLPLLDWPELERLSARGFAIGAHTHAHVPLTTVTFTRAVEEMERCANELVGRLGVPVSSFAYPYGDVNQAVATAAGARFRLAVTTRFAALTGDAPRALIPRFDMYYFRRPGAIHRLASGALDVWVNWVRFRRSARETFASARAPVAADR